jgi:hypothetical protein
MGGEGEGISVVHRFHLYCWMPGCLRVLAAFGPCLSEPDDVGHDVALVERG